MARVAAVFPYQWRAYWRNVKVQGFWHNANMMILVVVGVLALPGHIIGCVFAAAKLTSGNLELGVVVTESLLLGLMLAWLFVPLLSTSVESRGGGVSPARLVAFPFSIRELALVAATGALIKPIYWLLAIASVFVLVPLLATPYPLFGLIGGLLFIGVSASLSWALVLLGTALFSSRRARETGLLIVVFLLFATYILAHTGIKTVEGDIKLDTFGRQWLLIDRSGSAGLLTELRNWTPACWAVRAGLGELPGVWLACLCGTLVASIGVAIWSLQRAVAHPVVGLDGKGRRFRAISGISWLPAAVGVAAQKELRYLLRTMDALLVFGLAIAGAALFIWRVALPQWTPFVGIPLLLTCQIAIPLNAFGLDGRAVDRYRLFPLTGKQILLSKNIAYFLLVAMQLCPAWIATAWRCGIGVALAVVLGNGSLLLLHVMLGNRLSVRAAAPRAFYSFDQGSQAGGVLGILYAAVIWLVPGGVALATMALGAWILVAGQVIVFFACLHLYRHLIGTTGTLFDAEAEVMRKRLST